MLPAHIGYMAPLSRTINVTLCRLDSEYNFKLLLQYGHLKELGPAKYLGPDSVTLTLTEQGLILQIISGVNGTT